MMNLNSGFITALIILTIACSNEMETTNQDEIEKIKEFVIPDTINVKKELVFAAYYETHPKKACVIFAYNDTTRTSAKMFSYSVDSLFTEKELLKASYNEFRVKDEPGESYIIKPASVVWTHQLGNTAATAEYNRIDVAK